MGIKVAKFGGSSLADAACFKKVKAIVDADPEIRFVVPSAPGKRAPGDIKITDLLYMSIDAVRSGQDHAPIFGRIRARYLEIAQDLGLSQDLEAELDNIEKSIRDGCTGDYAASRGEYLNAKLLSEYLGFPFVDATDLICFRAGDGSYDDETTQWWSRKLETMECAVIPGFYGRRVDGGVRTFSRGGSDITGSIVARAVHADLYQNWTDVSGFMMADPRIVKDPRVIRVVTYSELRELSYMGATVLHEDSIFPVRRAGIPIQVKNTNAPEDPGTMIVPDRRLRDYPERGVMTGVAGRRGFTVITVTKDNMHREVGFGYRLLKVLMRHSISFEHCPSGIDTMSIVVSDEALRRDKDAVIAESQEECDPDAIEVQNGMALIATVGRGMVRSRGVAARLCTALSEAGVNIRMLDQGSSEMNIIVGVESEDFEPAIRAIYDCFKADLPKES